MSGGAIAARKKSVIRRIASKSKDAARRWKANSGRAYLIVGRVL